MNRILLAVIAALALVVGLQQWRVVRADAATARAVHAHDVDRAEWVANSAKSAEHEREIETLRRRAKDGVIDATRTENAALARRAGELDDAARRLREYVVAAVTARTGEGSGDPAAGAGSAATAGAGLVLADLYRSTDQEAIDLARAYDAARIAGLACERSYDSLTP